MENQELQNANNKINDWWGKHNVTTRSVIIVVLFLFVGTIILSWMGKDITHFDKIIDTLSDSLIILTVAIIAGVNGATAIMDKLIQWKKG